MSEESPASPTRPRHPPTSRSSASSRSSNGWPPSARLVSADTWKPAVARAAIAAGAAILNDVSGLRDPELADVAAQTGCALVVMHTRAEPKQVDFARYEGRVVADVEAFLRERIELAVGRGVSREQILVDPGPDFAKTPQESVEALRALPELHALGRPILLLVSRKYFVGAITGREPGERLAGTLAAALQARLPARRSCASTTSRRPSTRRASGRRSRASTRSAVRRGRRRTEVDPPKALASCSARSPDAGSTRRDAD